MGVNNKRVINSHTVMSRIKAGAYGRISRCSNHTSIQNMLLCLHCAVHAATHVRAHVLCRERLLFKPCFCVTARFKKSASIQVMLLYRSCFYTGHASIQVMLLYRSCFYSSHASIQVMLLYRSCFYSSHASIQVMLLYRSCFYTGHAFIRDTTVSKASTHPHCGRYSHKAKTKNTGRLVSGRQPLKKKTRSAGTKLFLGSFFWDPFFGSSIVVLLVDNSTNICA